MTPFIHTRILPAAFSLLPPEMDTRAARAMLLAIGLQESRFEHRRQVGGPACGFWQFEQGGGVKGVCTHAATRGHLDAALCALRYDGLVDNHAGLYAVIEHNDVVAAVCARLLLWTVPAPLPSRADGPSGWLQYLQAWRPGKAHPTTWGGYFARAWEMVEPTHQE